MIKVSVKPKCITIEGHADYDTLGKDIVCASVSSIVTTSINAILTLKEGTIRYESKKGLVKIDILKDEVTTDKLLKNMVNMLNELKDDYPKNIKIER